MRTEKEDLLTPPNLPEHANGVSDFFNHHLDRLYCAKSHLVERLSEIEGLEDELLLNDAISATIQSTEPQLVIVERVYEQAGRVYSFERCNRLISFLNDYFNAVQIETRNKPLHVLLLMAYLTYVKGVEQASLTLLQLCAARTGNNEMTEVLRICKEQISGDNALLTLLDNRADTFLF